MMNLVGQYNEKGVYFLTGDFHELQNDIDSLHPYFVCVIFLHKKMWVEAALKNLIKNLLVNGAVYFVFHGNQCEKAHDIADEVQSELIPESAMTYDNVIGTDWFSDSYADEVIFSAVCGSVPSDDYLTDFSSFVVISLGNDSENESIKELLRNLRSTIDMAVLRASKSSTH